MLKKLNFYNVKRFNSKKDEQVCKKAWEKGIELFVDEFGRVFDESMKYIADVEYCESEEY